jgi:hypothetical protein
MWPKGTLYPSKWTENWDLYLAHKKELIDIIKRILSAYNEENSPRMIYENRRIAEQVGEKYFNGAALYKTIIDSTT